MSLGTFLEKAETLAKLFEGDIQKIAGEALPITEKILADLNSQTAIVVESLIPNGATYAADVILAINAALPALKIIAGLGDASSTNGLLQRLGSEITSIIHGGKEPFSFYVLAFEYICFGGVAPTPAAVSSSVTPTVQA